LALGDVEHDRSPGPLRIHRGMAPLYQILSCG
jgi:hypothetical protein